MKRPTLKKTLNETLAENRRAEQGWANMFGKPLRKDAPMPKEKVVRAPRKVSEDLEGPVQSAISELLAVHPKVLFAVRQNSGMMQTEYTDSRGTTKQSYTWFYKWARRRSKKMRITDFWGMLIDGRTFAIEAKKPSWTKPTDDREREQLEFILTVRYAGGLGGFATSVDDAVRILEEAK